MRNTVNGFHYDEIWHFIKKGSSREPMSGLRIAEHFGLNTGKGYAQVRMVVHDMRIKGYLIGSNSKGYFPIETVADHYSTLKHLNSRSKLIREAMDALYESADSLFMGE